MLPSLGWLRSSMLSLIYPSICDDYLGRKSNCEPLFLFCIFLHFLTPDQCPSFKKKKENLPSSRLTTGSPLHLALCPVVGILCPPWNSWIRHSLLPQCWWDRRSPLQTWRCLLLYTVSQKMLDTLPSSVFALDYASFFKCFVHLHLYWLLFRLVSALKVCH